jgi:hypothetical protein
MSGHISKLDVRILTITTLQGKNSCTKAYQIQNSSYFLMVRDFAKASCHNHSEFEKSQVHLAEGSLVLHLLLLASCCWVVLSRRLESASSSIGAPMAADRMWDPRLLRDSSLPQGIMLCQRWWRTSTCVRSSRCRLGDPQYICRCRQCITWISWLCFGWLGNWVVGTSCSITM